MMVSHDPSIGRDKESASVEKGFSVSITNYDEHNRVDTRFNKLAQVGGRLIRESDWYREESRTDRQAANTPELGLESSEPGTHWSTSKRCFS
jgi:hypothetical protein